MATIFGHIEPFNPKSDVFSEYKERLNYYFVANSVEDDEKKKAIFLTLIGSVQFRLLKDLCAPVDISAKNFVELCTILQNHHQPKPPKFLQRTKFESRVRQPGESIQQYIAILRNLSQFCEFGNTLEERLCERFVRGINNERIQRRLLSETNLNLHNAIEIAVAITQSAEGARELETCSINVVQKNIKKHSVNNNFTRNNQSRKCHKCLGDHQHKSCPYKDYKCHGCGMKGHLKKACKNKQQSRQHNRNKIFQVEGDNVDSEFQNYDLFTIYSGGNPAICNKISANSGNPAIRNLNVNKVPIDFQIDTGAACSVMNHNDFTNNFKDLRLEDSTASLKTYSGQNIEVVGSTEVLVEYSGSIFKLPLIVTKGSAPPLLGRNWLREINPQWEEVLVVSSENVTINNILHKYESVFNNNAGCLKDHKVKLHVNPNHSPKYMKSRQPPFALREQIQAELNRLEASGIIEKVQFSDWATPIVPIPKKDGSLRICGDYKVTVNKVINQDEYPIPRLEDLTSKLAGGVKFTSIDFSHAYTQLQLESDSKNFTTINTHCGLFRYLRLPFGISSCPQIFQRTIEHLFKDIPFCAIYFDNMIVSGIDDKDHYKNLNDVFQIISEKGLTVKKEKCEFFKNEVKFLGHILSAQGLKPLPERIEAVKNAPEPKSTEEVKAYVGLLNYYGKYIHNLSHELAPLYDLLKKGNRFVWGKVEKEAFEKSKTFLTSDSLLVHFNPNEQIVLTCDASPRGIAAILSHKFSDGTEKPVAFVSRSLNKAERNYSQLDREALSLVFGVTKFHKFIYGIPFTLVTDHKPLLGLFGEHKSIPEMASSRLIRWAVTLSGYSYRLVHRPGRDNNADALSRLPLSDCPRDVPIPCDVSYVFNILNDTPVTAALVAEETLADNVLVKALNFTKSGWPEKVYDENLKPFFSRKNELSVDQNCLLWGTRVVIPKSLQKQVLNIIHEEHTGIVKMKGIARGVVWWHGIDADIEKIVKSCFECQQNRNAPASAPLYSWSWPDKPWSRIHLDYAGPFMGNMFLIVVDAHSKWIDVKVMSNITSQNTIFQLKEIFATHGLPDVVVTDNGTSFCSSDFEAFLKHNGVQHIKSAPYHPATNGLAERAVQTFKQNLKCMQKGTIHEKVLRFLTKYRVTPQSSTGVSPAELLLGRKLKTKLDLVHPYVHSNVHKSLIQQKKIHDQHARDRDLSLDDDVFVRNYSSGPKWVHGTIVKQTGPISFKVQTDNNNIIKRHQDQIRQASCFDSIPESQGGREDDNSNFSNDTSNDIVDLTKENIHTPQLTDNATKANEIVHPPQSTDNSKIVKEVTNLDKPINQPLTVRRSGRAVKPPDKLNL